MKRKQNIIIFSAGESVRNGNVEYIKTKLCEKGINCFEWRELFEKVHDTNHIALLPNLLKKIPTFDFALIIAEAVDTIQLRGDNSQIAMRDNVIFELGLCVMALGVERVILLAEEGIRIPEDLAGIKDVGIDLISFSKQQIDVSIAEVSETVRNKTKNFDNVFSRQLDEIIDHINVNSDLISPVFVGAAISSAEAYFLNFIVRFLENIEKDFFRQDGAVNQKFSFPNNTKIKIIIPASLNILTRTEISKFYEKHNVERFVIPDAGIRSLYFNGIFDEGNNSLLIIDIPTSVTASYTVVNSVLNIDSDDEYDAMAEERFVAKEMDVYAYALNKLLLPSVAEKRLAFIENENTRKNIIKQLKKVSVEILSEF